MGLSPRRMLRAPFLRPLAVLGILAAASCAPSWGQVNFTPDRSAAFAVGPTRLYPLFGLSYQHTDNLFYRSGASPGDVQSSWISTGVGGVLLELPVSNSVVRLGLAHRSRRYTEQPGSDGLYGTAAANLVFGNGTTLDLKDDYERGQVDAQTFRGGIPGVPSSGEIAFTGEPYRRNAAGAEAAHPVGYHHKLAVRYSHEDVAFGGDHAFGFFDVASDSLEVRGEATVRPGSRLVWSVEALANDLSRPASPEREGGLPPLYPAASSRQDGLTVRAGWHRDLGSGGTLNLSAGGIRIRVRSDTSFSYQGPVGSLEYVRSVPDRFYASVSYHRNVYPSAFTSNSLFVGDSLDVRVSTPAVLRFLGGGDVAFTRNAYSEAGGGRVDDVTYVQGWVGYRFFRALRLYVFYVHETRRSSVPGGGFAVNQFGSRVSWGF